MTPRRLVILGTGTGVGKTFVTALLIRALRDESVRGTPVIALKPIETGLHASRGGRPPLGSDARTLEDAATFEPVPHPLFGYSRPVSPHLEAARTGRRIDIRRITSWIRRAESDAALHDTGCTIIETAGAALSPLGLRTTNFDLARALEPATWIVVAPDAIGVLHDVRVTWTALASLGRTPDHLVLTASREPDASTGTNARELRRLGLPRPAAVVPRGATDPTILRAFTRTLLAHRCDH